MNILHVPSECVPHDDNVAIATMTLNHLLDIYTGNGGSDKAKKLKLDIANSAV